MRSVKSAHSAASWLLYFCHSAKCQTTKNLKEDFHLCNAADIFSCPRHLFELGLECQSLRKPQTDAILCSDQRLWTSIGVRDGSSKHCGGWRWERWQIHLVVGDCGASSNPHTQQNRNSVSSPLSSSLWAGRTRSSGEAAGCSPSDIFWTGARTFVKLRSIRSCVWLCVVLISIGRGWAEYVKSCDISRWENKQIDEQA